MIIFPAIDIYEGKAVRLVKGSYEKMTVYSDNPSEIGETFAAKGARNIHIVDLEGAKEGSNPNFEIICDIKKKSGCFCEVGGGVRNMNIIDKYISAGIDRVILGTVAVTDEAFLKEALRKYNEQIAIGVDIKDGYVAIKGWTEKSNLTAKSFCAKLERWGVRTIIVTDISKDGAMQGTNHVLYEELSSNFNMQIVASGGISSIDDVRMLASKGLYGAIIGKAYYTGAIKLEEAVEVTK